jgi:hypothetical protein
MTIYKRETPLGSHKLTLLEGKWYQSIDVSVRDVLRPLFDLHGTGQSNCYYEMFTTDASFHSAIEYAFGHDRPEAIYVAAHGSDGGIAGYHGTKVSRVTMRNSIAGAGGTVKRGILFGACAFSSEENASFLLDGCSSLAWVGGYDRTIDWMESTLLDLFFIRHLIFPNPDLRKYDPLSTALDRVEYAASRVKEIMPNLATQMGFHVFRRKHGNAGGVVDLMQAAYQSA